MQVYNNKFAKVFDKEYSGFTQSITPYLLHFWENKASDLENTGVLDLCCGTGHLALSFLEKGYSVAGVDCSASMLEIAQLRNINYVKNGKATFIQQDVSQFSNDEKYGLITSTYDSMNHLDDQIALEKCFRAVFKNLVMGGFLIFDLNTRKSLLNWNNISYIERDDLIMLSRGLFDTTDNRALIKISGFVSDSSGLYERFEQSIFNTVYNLQKVKSLLVEIGWREVRFTTIHDLSASIDDPENIGKENEVFVIAKK